MYTLNRRASGVVAYPTTRYNHELLMRVREASGREASPSAGVIDSQSVKTSEAGAVAPKTSPAAVRLRLPQAQPR
jgi:hypothetical protein